MSLFISFLIALAVFILAVLFFPQPRYGQMRGCTGLALQTIMELEAKNKDAGEAAAPETKEAGRQN